MFYSVGYENARKNLSELMNKITAETEIFSFSGAFIGCSALDCESDKETTKKLCDGIINADKIKMHSDVYIALKSVKNAECPCVAICGTGSIATGEDENGNIHVTGGWGHILGDEGSAYSIALTAIKTCCAMTDEDKKAPILDSANEFFEVDDFRKAIDIIYSPDMTKDRLARFASVVGQLADDGDETAQAVMTHEAQAFVSTAESLLQKVKNCDVFGLYGGVFQHNRIFREKFCEFIKHRYPDLTTKLIETPPEETAATLARNL
jgi:N-acetylglucosamine kinase-like BadF-type ATPase